MTFLLDVNVLIALIDPAHVSHEACHDWMEREGGASWATCPLTENGVIRILGHPKYRNFSGSTAAICAIIGDFARAPGHVFWPDDISLRDERYFEQARILAHGQVTDSYLLGLAVAHGGALATLNRRLVTDAVKRGRDGLRVI